MLAFQGEEKKALIYSIGQFLWFKIFLPWLVSSYQVIVFNQEVSDSDSKPKVEWFLSFERSLAPTFTAPFSDPSTSLLQSNLCVDQNQLGALRENRESQSPALALLNWNLQQGWGQISVIFFKSIISDSDSVSWPVFKNHNTYIPVSSVSSVHFHLWMKDTEIIIIQNLIYSLNQPYL